MREENEDSVGTLELPDGHFLTVCDGMGGYAGGKIASETAVARLLEYVKENHDPENVPEVLRRAIDAANDAVRTKAKADSRLGEMGTTCVAALVLEDKYWIAHVGDSRAYLLRDAVFKLHTLDHTVVQQLVDQGRISPLDAANHPSAGILVRCLGQLDSVEVEISGPHPLRPGDRLLLCSDGLSGMLYEDDIAKVLSAQSLKDAVANLIKYANELGGFDNITAATLQAGRWPEDALEWKIVVHSQEGRALAAAEAAAAAATPMASPSSSPDVGYTRNTMILSALSPDDTRELNLPDQRGWEPGHDLPRKLGFAALVLFVVVGLVIYIMTR
ncbi:MAG: protein phosphatase 2C domain-containing protein [bacterium]